MSDPLLANPFVVSFVMMYGIGIIFGSIMTFHGLRKGEYTIRKSVYCDLGITFGWPLLLVAGFFVGVGWCIIKVCKFFWFNPVKAVAELPTVVSMNDVSVDDDGDSLGGAVSRVEPAEYDSLSLELVSETTDLNNNH